MGHVVQISRLPLDANVKLNLSNKGLGRDDKRRHFFFLGLRDWSKSIGGGGGPEHLEIWLIKNT